MVQCLHTPAALGAAGTGAGGPDQILVLPKSLKTRFLHPDAKMPHRPAMRMAGLHPVHSETRRGAFAGGDGSQALSEGMALGGADT